MVDPQQFTDFVIKPALIELDSAEFVPYSETAVKLILGTALQESRLSYIKQLGGGPAVGFFQMEPATYKDIVSNYINHNHDLKTYLQISVSRWVSSVNHLSLATDLIFSTIMCRLHYYRVSEALPGDDIKDLARYWKRYYNTEKGKGTTEEFVMNWNKYGASVKV